MALTIREKEEWSSMLNSKIDAKIKQIWAENPQLKTQIMQQARSAAVEAMGLTDILKKLETQKAKATQAMSLVKDLLQVAIGPDSHISGSDEPTCDKAFRYTINDLEGKIGSNTNALFKKYLAAHPVGKKIHTLEDEKSNVKQAIWLATSPNALRALWKTFIDKLGLDTSDLEDAAFNTPA